MRIETLERDVKLINSGLASLVDELPRFGHAALFSLSESILISALNVRGFNGVS